MQTEFDLIKSDESFKIKRGDIVIGIYMPYNTKISLNEPLSIEQIKTILELVEEL